MIQQVNLNQFIDAFISMNRDYYTYDGYEVIYNYLEDIDENYNLDVVAICSEFSEYTEEELQNAYGVDNSFKNMSDEIKEMVIGETESTVILREA